jgi:hypothetical protein
MVDFTLDDLFRAALRLPPDDQEALVSRLSAVRQHPAAITREQLIAEFEARKAAGQAKSIRDLRDKYSGSALDSLTDEQLRAEIRQSAAEWKSDLDDRLEAD